MKAANLYGPGDLRVEDVPYPTRNEDEIILKIHCASICNGSDGALYSGRRNRKIAYPDMELPWVLGHECAGEIVEVGDGVNDFQVGDRVASLRYGHAFAEYQTAEPGQLIRVPEGMPYEKATYIELLFATLAYMKYIRQGDSVVICGAGPSGLTLLQDCLAMGAEKVCMVDRIPFRLQAAERSGAQITVDASSTDGVEEIKDRFGEPEVFIDATGYDVYDFGLRVLKKFGRLVMYGAADSGVSYNGTRAFFKGIEFCARGETDDKEIEALVLKMIEEEKVKLGTFTTHHFPLARVPEAMDLVLEKPEEAIGVILDAEQE